MSPDRSEDPLFDDGPTLTAEEEAAVRGLLAVLPDPELPADVRARIVAATAPAALASRPDGAVDGDPATDADGRVGTGGSAPEAAGSSRRGAHAARKPGMRGAWLLQSAAVLVLVALIAAVVVGVVGDDDGDGGSGGSLVASQPTAGPVTTSGRDYTGATLAGQVRGLVVGATGTTSSGAKAQPERSARAYSSGADGGALGDADAGEGQSLAASAGDGALTAAQKREHRAAQAAARAAEQRAARLAAEQKAVAALIANPVARQACVDRLAGVAGAQAITVDVGTYEGRPAAVVVLPDGNDPKRVAAWVVGPTCSDRDTPFPYRFERVTRP